MVVYDLDLLILTDDAPFDASDGDTSDILVVVDAGDEHLEGRVKVLFGCGNVFEDRLEKRLEVGARHFGAVACGALSAGAEKHGGVKLLVGRIEVHQKLKHLVHDLVYTLVGAVDLVHDDDDTVTQLKRPRQDEAGLRHGTLRRIDEKDDAVYHLENTLDLAAEVGVSRRIDDVYFGIAVLHGGVLCHDGYAALTLKVVRVHDSFDDLLIFPVNAALLEHLVNESGLAVVNVSDDCYVSELVHKYNSL